MKIKNLSSVILAAMMAASVVPNTGVTAPYSSLASYAIEAETEYVTEDEVFDEDDDIISGTLGENAYWTLYYGCLSIDGEGTVDGYADAYDAPWAEYGEEVDSVEVGEDVTGIDENLFNSCIYAHSIGFFNPDCVIPDSETAIPESMSISGYSGSTAEAYAEKYNRDFYAYAKEMASGFCGENVSWGLYDTGVLSISGEGAMDSFDDFSNTPWAEYVDVVTSINIWDVTRIGDNALTGFENAEDIEIYNSECEIADSDTVFPANAIIYADINSTTHEYAEKYGISFEPFLYEVANGVLENGQRWHMYSDGYLIIDGEGDLFSSDNIYPWKEYSEDITYVALHDASSVGDYAFYNCKNIHTVLNSVSVIGAHAFEGCTNLVTFDLNSWGTLDKIDDYAFYNTGLETITIENIECEIAMSPYVFPESTVIYGYRNSTAEAYAEMFGREFFAIDNRVQGELENGVNWYLDNNGVLLFEGEGSMPDYDGAYPWSEYADEITSVDFVKEFSGYGDYAFYNCQNITYATLPAVIGAHAFENCINLSSYGYYADHPMREIKDYAFYGCDSLEMIEISDPECVIADSPYVFPENTTIRGYVGSTAEAYANKYNREFIDIEDIYYENVIAEGTCGEDLTWVLDSDYTLFIDGTGEMTEWESVDEVPWAEFNNDINLVIIEDNVGSISRYAFSEFTTDDTLLHFFNDECVIPDVEGVISPLAYICCNKGSNAYKYAEKYNIGYYLYSGESVDNTFTWSCNESGDIFYITGNGDMPDYEIGERPWEDVIDQMESVYFYGNITSIGKNAFAGSESLRFVDIDEEIKFIDEDAFAGCDNLETLNFHGNYNCEIYGGAGTIPSQTVIIAHNDSPAYKYAEMYGLEHYGISEETVPPFASGEFGMGFTWGIYDECNQLFISGVGDMPEWENAEDAPWAEYFDVIEMVMIDENVTSIPANLFDGLTDDNIIVYVYNDDCVIPDMPGAIPYDAYVICGGESTAHDYAEKYCISHYADGCDVEYHYEGFTWSCNEDGDIFYITGYGDMPDYEIGERPWEDVIDQMKSVYFYGDITSIGKNAFAGSESLEFVDVDEKIQFIGEDAFAGCDNLQTLNFHGNYICEIYDSASTIPAHTTIIAHEGTPAQAYADKYSMTYYGIAGDANCDGRVSIADATAIFQSIANPDKYTLSDEGRRNADVAGDDGITVEDAILIQKYDAKLIEEI